MRSVTYAEVEQGVAAIAGIDPTSILAHEKVLLANYISDATKYCWDYYPWAEFTETEIRKFRDNFIPNNNYLANDEVYFEGKFYRARVDTSDAQVTDHPTANWYEIGDIDAAPDWVENGCYSIGAKVNHEGKTYICISQPISQIDIVGNGVEPCCFDVNGVTTSNAAFFEEISTTFDRYIAYEQTGKDAIGTMISASLEDPRYTDSTPLDWTEGKEGVYFNPNGITFNEVWVKYRIEAPTFTSASANEKLPRFLIQAIKAFSYKSWLVGDGQHEKAQLQDVFGMDLLVRELDKLDGQNDRGRPYTIAKNPYRRINAKQQHTAPKVTDRIGSLHTGEASSNLTFSLTTIGKQAVVRGESIINVCLYAKAEGVNIVKKSTTSSHLKFSSNVEAKNSVKWATIKSDFKIQTGTRFRDIAIGKVKGYMQKAGYPVDEIFLSVNLTSRGLRERSIPINGINLGLTSNFIGRNVHQKAAPPWMPLKLTTSVNGYNSVKRGLPPFMNLGLTTSVSGINSVKRGFPPHMNLKLTTNVEADKGYAQVLNGAARMGSESVVQDVGYDYRTGSLQDIDRRTAAHPYATRALEYVPVFRTGNGTPQTQLTLNSNTPLHVPIKSSCTNFVMAGWIDMSRQAASQPNPPVVFDFTSDATQDNRRYKIFETMGSGDPLTMWIKKVNGSDYWELNVEGGGQYLAASNDPTSLVDNLNWRKPLWQSNWANDKFQFFWISMFTTTTASGSYKTLRVCLGNSDTSTANVYGFDVTSSTISATTAKNTAFKFGDNTHNMSFAQLAYWDQDVSWREDTLANEMEQANQLRKAGAGADWNNMDIVMTNPIKAPESYYRVADYMRNAKTLGYQSVREIGHTDGIPNNGTTREEGADNLVFDPHTITGTRMWQYDDDTLRLAELGFTGDFTNGVYYAHHRSVYNSVVANKDNFVNDQTSVSSHLYTQLTRITRTQVDDNLNVAQTLKANTKYKMEWQFGDDAFDNSVSSLVTGLHTYLVAIPAAGTTSLDVPMDFFWKANEGDQYTAYGQADMQELLGHGYGSELKAAYTLDLTDTDISAQRVAAAGNEGLDHAVVLTNQVTQATANLIGSNNSTYSTGGTTRSFNSTYELEDTRPPTSYDPSLEDSFLVNDASVPLSTITEPFKILRLNCYHSKIGFYWKIEFTPSADINLHMGQIGLNEALVMIYGQGQTAADEKPQIARAHAFFNEFPTITKVS